MSSLYDYFNSSKVLVIDDEPQMRKLLKLSLEHFNVKVIEAISGKEGIDLAQMYSPDLIILDMNLGDMNGLAVLKTIREWYEKPIIIISVENNSEGIVKALNFGADDYVTKPFDVNELLARIHVSFRRLKKKEIENPIFKYLHLEVNFSRRIVLLKGEEIRLTAIEFDLLKLFVQNQGKVLTHRQILKEVWGPSNVEHNDYPRVYVRHLRKKIEEDPNYPKLILTEPSVGYRFSS